MSKEKSGISRIIITIAGKEVTCTPEQVKDLKEALDKMYPAPVSPLKEYQYIPYPVYPKPYRWDWPYINYLSNQSGSVTLCAKA